MGVSAATFFGTPAQGLGQQAGEAPDEARCSAGVITSIDVDRRSVFDPESTDVGAVSWTYRALNLLHVRTSPSFIRRELLVKEGDCYDAFLLAESQRLLDGYGFLSQARVTDQDDGAGGHRLLVETQDEWSTQIDVGITYDEGPNVEKVEVTEENFLGQGVRFEFAHRERRETRAQSLALSTPRFFGRTDAGILIGRDRPGNFFTQYIRYPFIGETGRYSVRQEYTRGTSFFSYSTDGAEDFTQVLVPAYREILELSVAKRFGELGKSVLAGVTLARDVVQFRPNTEVTYADDFDAPQPFPGALPPLLDDQLRPSAATRLSLHVGRRRARYVQYEGLDGVRDRMLVTFGSYIGASVGRGFTIFALDGVPTIQDWFGRAHAEFAAPAGSSILHGRFTVESRRDAVDWQDLLVDTDLVAYLRNDGLRSHTVFVRAALAGGWKTSMPYQLSLGGREGIRSLVEDRYPGGRMARFVVEDRIVFPWPRPGSADLGLTAFADLGRVWAGDVPYAVDSGWQAAIGVGLRIGFPAGTRNIWRTDVAFPVGPTGGSPIFRVTFELNKLRYGFFTSDVTRSRRFNLGADKF